jgi:AhpD family alkylhydroperoxidase
VNHGRGKEKIMKELMDNFQQSMAEFSKSNPEEFKRFNEFISSIHQERNLSRKTKELIALAIAIVVKCSICVAAHTEGAFKAGATKEELMEAATVSVLMGGGPALAYITHLKEAIDLYENKKQKR